MTDAIVTGVISGVGVGVTWGLMTNILKTLWKIEEHLADMRRREKARR